MAKTDLNLEGMSFDERRNVLKRKGRLNTKEAALFLDLSHRTLEKWRNQNKGPLSRVFGRGWRYDVTDLEAYESQSVRYPEEAA